MKTLTLIKKKFGGTIINGVLVIEKFVMDKIARLELKEEDDSISLKAILGDLESPIEHREKINKCGWPTHVEKWTNRIKL